MRAAVKENYYALYISIVRGLSSMNACRAMGLPVQETGKSKPYSIELDDETLEKVISLKSDHTWTELGEMYGIKAATLHGKVKRYMGDDWENREW